MKTYKERIAEVRQQMIAEMTEMRRQGMTMERIGEVFGVKRAAVNNFLKGHNRKGCG